MASSSPPSLAMRPSPHLNSVRQPKTVSDFIARINATPGGFRLTTEESLRAQLAAKQNGVFDTQDTEMGDETEGAEEDEADGQHISMADFRKQQDEVIRNIEIAHQSASQALDLVSLLLTKELPTQAGATLSPALRNLVGIGTLGAGKITHSNINDAELLDNKLVSTGWKFTDINKTADSVLSAATRLQREISLETKYWADVLAVSDKGWAVTRIPGAKHTLGVRYGFSEAVPSFRDSSLAAMRRSENGSVELDYGRLSGQAKRVRVGIERGGKVIGTSTMPRPLPNDASVDERVLEARNTVFAQELWQEINKEGRNMLSYGVKLENEVVSYQLDSSTRIIIELRDTAKIDNSDQHQTHKDEQSTLGQSIATALDLLLAHAHRQHAKRRSGQRRQQDGPTPAYVLLRPVIAYFLHEKAVRESIKFFSEVVKVLRSAGFSDARFIFTEPPIAVAKAADDLESSTSEVLVNSVLGSMEFQIQLALETNAKVLIRARTIIVPVVTTTYHIFTLPNNDDGDERGDLVHNLIEEAYPPKVSPLGYPTLGDVKDYIRHAIANFLTLKAQEAANTPVSGNEQQPTESWNRTIAGTTLGSPLRNSWMQFAVNFIDKNPTDGIKEQNGQYFQDKMLQLRLLTTHITKDGTQTRKIWTWPPHSSENQNETLGSLTQRVDELINLDREKAKHDADKHTDSVANMEDADEWLDEEE